MLKLESWIVGSRLFKMYFGKGSGFAAAARLAASETRSRPVERRTDWPRTFHAFAWKI